MDQQHYSIKQQVLVAPAKIVSDTVGDRFP
jgi:hypothetical protein